MVDTTAASMSPGWTPALVLRNVLAFAANMLQVYGVLYWRWDIFQILMLYWMETAVIGSWALLRLAVLPADLLGKMTVNGQVVAATNTLLLQKFVPFVAISMAAHLLILWVVFSGASTANVYGPISFASEFIIASGAGCRCCSRCSRVLSAFMKVRNGATSRAQSETGCCRRAGSRLSPRTSRPMV